MYVRNTSTLITFVLGVLTFDLRFEADQLVLRGLGHGMTSCIRKCWNVELSPAPHSAKNPQTLHPKAVNPKRPNPKRPTSYSSQASLLFRAMVREDTWPYWP